MEEQFETDNEKSTLSEKEQLEFPKIRAKLKFSKHDLQPKKVDTVERVVQTIPPPIREPLSTSILFNAPTRPKRGFPFNININSLQTHLFGEGRLHKEDLSLIIESATELFLREPTLLLIDDGVTICGDIHGQFYDLLRLLEIGGNPSETTYLFLGDYVDRGSFSIEVISLLYCYKILYPKTFFLIRGNHECRHLTQYFTFKSECFHKYDLQIYNLVMASFDALPLAALVNKQFLCVHGGISPKIQTLERILKIDRFCEPPEVGPMCDLLWADPMEHFDLKSEMDFEFNEVRGCSYTFGYRAACSFLDKNNLLSIIRAHEVQDQGYLIYRKNEATGFPCVITVFSAPNYLDSFNNKGAILRYEKNILNIRQFNHVGHPYWLPNFMDVFNWSLPFVAEKIAEIVLAVFNACDEEEDSNLEQAECDRRRELLRTKVKTVSRLLRMYKILREEREVLMQIKSFTPENKIPHGLLSAGVQAIHDALGNFEKSKMLDQINEKRPSMLPEHISTQISLE